MGGVRLPTSIGYSVRFNWPQVTGEIHQFIHTVGNPLLQCRPLGTNSVNKLSACSSKVWPVQSRTVTD